MLDFKGPIGAPDGGNTYEGIYKIERDTMVWCWTRKEVRERRPSFDAGKGIYAECLTRVKQ